MSSSRFYRQHQQFQLHPQLKGRTLLLALTSFVLTIVCLDNVFLTILSFLLSTGNLGQEEQCTETFFQVS